MGEGLEMWELVESGRVRERCEKDRGYRVEIYEEIGY